MHVMWIRGGRLLDLPLGVFWTETNLYVVVEVS